MRKHYVCLHTNLHVQTSRFHFYVNTQYVNKPSSTGGGGSWWAYADHFDSIRSGPHLSHVTIYKLSKSDNSPIIGNICKFHSFTQTWSEFLDCDMIGWKWCLVEQMLSNNRKIELVCFLTYITDIISLFPIAGMLHSFGVTLILFSNIPLIFVLLAIQRK